MMEDAPRGLGRATMPILSILGFVAACMFLGCGAPSLPGPGGIDTTSAPAAPVRLQDDVTARESTTGPPTGRLVTAPNPAAPAEDPALRERLAAALAARGPSYVARTRHKDAAGHPQFTNRLILEASPYLVQHAHNPVDWFPWGPEAFTRAQDLGRPIFLSVGYATCHWCHVMEEESFEDEEVASYLNAHYVAIKVDREERPDVDAVYMTFLQQQSGRGGWPMSVWLTPDRDPFFAGTYFPRREFLASLQQQAERFATEPARVSLEAKDAVTRLQTLTATADSGSADGGPGAAQLGHAVAVADAIFDPVNGGRRGAPKFPSSFPVRVLLRAALRTGNARALEMARVTLDHIAAGSIRDQLGGGFHRYATRADWNVPHFEKMLYDNALLADAYLEAGQLTDERRYLDVSRETLSDLLATFTLPDGTFASATDADSPGSARVGVMPAFGSPDRRDEGLYFTWTPAELVAALGPDDARIAAAWFSVTEAGRIDGRSDLALSPGAAGPAAGPSPDTLAHLRAALLARRAQRPPPLRDDKALTAWNALAISALARAAIVSGDDHFGAAALRAAQAFAAALHAGRPVPHYLRDGTPRGAAFLDDLGLLGNSFLDIFELTADPRWLDDAAAIADDVDARFADRSRGGYFQTPDGADALLYREKPADDGPTPSGDSAMALLLLRLDRLTLAPRFGARAARTLGAYGAQLDRAPLSLDQMLLAVDLSASTSVEIVVVLPDGARPGALSPEARELLDVLRGHFVPGASLVVAPAAALEDLARRGDRAAGSVSGTTPAAAVPWVADKVALHGRPTAYVCQARVCQLPASDPATFERTLASAYRPPR